MRYDEHALSRVLALLDPRCHRLLKRIVGIEDREHVLMLLHLASMELLNLSLLCLTFQIGGELALQLIDRAGRERETMLHRLAAGL